MQKYLRKLAQSYKYQILYNRAKDLGTLKLFKNDSELSSIQIRFLYWLEVYSSLYLDLASGKDYIDEEIIKDNLRCEAYLLLREIERKKSMKEQLDTRKTETRIASDVPGVRFRKTK